MDSKIKKYAGYCQTAAWILMIMGILQWIVKWFIDWILYGIRDIDLAKYKSMAEVFEKMPKEQLYRFVIVDSVFKSDYSGGWIGIFGLSKFSWGSWFLGFLSDGISIGILVIGFYFFIKLMKELKKGSVFSSPVIDLLNKLSNVIFWFALYLPVNRTLVNMIMAFQNPPGQRFFFPSITLVDIFIFAVSWFFVILTSLMKESKQLKTEQDLTI
ncbi:MAG: DUF2975 domain-containing protein [Candidatus Babeliales bacterium]